MSEVDAEPPADGTSTNERVDGSEARTDTRWKKGQSGNPKGRPRSADKKHGRPDPAFQPMTEIILKLLYEPMPVLIDGKEVTILGAEALVRTTFRAATKGSRLALKWLMEFLLNYEKVQGELRNKKVDDAINYQNTFGQLFDDLRNKNLPEPNQLPHPDDIDIDTEGLNVRVNGPITRQQKLHLDHLIQRRDEWREGLANAQREYLVAENQEGRDFWSEDWKHGLKTFNYFNDLLPKRYKIELPLRECMLREAADNPKSKEINQFEPEIYKRDMAHGKLLYWADYYHLTKHKGPDFEEFALTGWRSLERKFNELNSALPAQYQIKILDAWKSENSANDPPFTGGLSD